MRDRIGEAAQDRLAISSYPALRSIACSCRDGVLTLRGCLQSHHQKQLALAIVADLEGVREIVSEVRVAPPARQFGDRDERWRTLASGRR